MGHIESQVGWLAVMEYPSAVNPAAPIAIRARQQLLLDLWAWMRDPDNIAIAKLTIDPTEVLYEAGQGPQAAVPGNPAANPVVAAIAAVPAGPNYIKILKSDFDTYRARMAQVYNHILASVTEEFKLTLINLKTTDPYLALQKLDSLYMGVIPEKTADLIRDEIKRYTGEYVLGTAVRLAQTLEDLGQRIAVCPGEIYGHREQRRDLMRCIPDTGDWGSWKLSIDNMMSMTIGPPPAIPGAPIQPWREETRYTWVKT